MATQAFTVTDEGGPRTVSGLITLRAAAAPTTSYVATTDDALCLGWDEVTFGIVYVNGDETSIQIRPQGYDGTSWRDLTYKAPQATAVSELTPDVVQLTKATFSTFYGAGATATIQLPPCNVAGCRKVRLMVKSTGGTPTGTIAVTATAQRVTQRA